MKGVEQSQTWQSSAKLEVKPFVVRSGFGDESVHLGQTEVEIKTLLGKPDRVIRKYEDSHFYVYQNLGIDLDFGSKDNDLQIIFFYAEDVEGHKCANAETDKGVRLGDSRSKVLRTYGEPDSRGDASVLHDGTYSRGWFYYNEGIQFRFSSDGNVDNISISKPQEPKR